VAGDVNNPIGNLKDAMMTYVGIELRKLLQRGGLKNG
jgi:hypothetical protein